MFFLIWFEFFIFEYTALDIIYFVIVLHHKMRKKDFLFILTLRFILKFIAPPSQIMISFVHECISYLCIRSEIEYFLL